MMSRDHTAALVCSILFVTIPLQAEEPGSDFSEAEIRQAIEQGLEIVQTGARNYPNHRQCFSCHHQTLPLLAMTAARDVGFTIDEPLLKSQLQFTRASFEERAEDLEDGVGIGGRAATVGFGLWTLEIVDDEADDLSAKMVTYLLKQQEEDGRWKPPSNRPPLEESHVSCTVLAAYGMRLYHEASQKEQVEQSIERAVAWLETAELESQEDHVARLWGLYLFDGEPEQIEAAQQALLKRQREDGGWGQLADMESDAYATGQTLYILHESGFPASAPEFQRGGAFLLKTQEEDGSWFVETRSKRVQVFFDNGDPHGKNQFISISATSWAVAALARALR